MKILAKTVYLYFRVYQHWLIENHLDDDSSSILAKDLIDFVDNQIEEEDRERIIGFCKEAY